MMRCPVCHRMIHKHTSVCKVCGTDIDATGLATEDLFDEEEENLEAYGSSRHHATSATLNRTGTYTRTMIPKQQAKSEQNVFVRAAQSFYNKEDDYILTYHEEKKRFSLSSLKESYGYRLIPIFTVAVALLLLGGYLISSFSSQDSGSTDSNLKTHTFSIGSPVSGTPQTPQSRTSTTATSSATSTATSVASQH